MGWEDSLNVFHYIYSKEIEGKRGKNTMEVIKEVQEYPNKPLELNSIVIN